MPILQSEAPNIDDLNISTYKVVVIDVVQQQSQDLSQLVTSIQWDYDLDQPAEHYQISFAHTENIAQKVKPGDRIKLYGYANTPVPDGIQQYWQILKHIYIVNTTLSSSSGGELKLQGYNVFWYLTRNKDTIMLEQEKASDFITRTAAYYGIPLGKIADTGVQLEREPFMNRTIWDMWVTALSYTRDLNSTARFILQEVDGKINLVAKQSSPQVWQFSRGQFNPGPQSWQDNPGNIFSSDNTFSMENFVDVVRVYKPASSSTSGSNPLGGDASEPSLLYQYPSQDDINAGKVADIIRYGMLSESMDLQMPGEQALDLGDEGANAEQQAMKYFKRYNKVENTGNITTFNINTVRPGDAVFVKDEISGLVGRYYVKSGSHVVTDSESSMTLTVNIEDALPEAYEAQRQRRTTSTSVIGPVTPTTPKPTTTPTTTDNSIQDPWTEVQLVTKGFTPADAGQGPGDAPDTGDDPHDLIDV